MTKKFENTWPHWVGSLALVVTLSACSTETNTKTEITTATPAEQKPFEMTILNSNTSTEAPKEDSKVKQELEKLTNTKLQINWIPRPAYKDKFNTLLASNELPHAVLVLDPKDPNVVSTVQSGAFWDIGPYLKDYPNLSKMNPKALENSKIDGKLYGVIRARDLGLHGVIYRKDWADRLGLKEPKTLDDLYVMAKAFTFNDPDNNGKNDTIGFAENKNLEAFGSIATYFGAPGGWDLKDGHLTPGFASPEFLNAMTFVKKMYDEKIINTDFALINQEQRKGLVSSGKAGIFVGPLGFLPDVAKSSEKAGYVFDGVNALEGPKGLRASGGPGFFGMFMFSKKANKTEADLKKSLAFFDKIATQDGNDLLYYGVKDDYYTIENGIVVKNPEKKDIATIDYQFFHLGVAIDSLITPLKQTPEEAKRKKLVAANEAIAGSNPVSALISKTYTEKGSELDKTIDDATTKYIMGVINEEAWKQAIANWKKSGGDEVTKEFEAQLNKK